VFLVKKHWLILLGLGLVCGACQKPAEPEALATPPPATNSTPAGGGGGGIAPIGPNIGGMTPVAGSDSVGGAGGGSVGSAAKDMARRTAAGAGAPAGMGSTAGVENND